MFNFKGLTNKKKKDTNKRINQVVSIKPYESMPQVQTVSILSVQQRIGVAGIRYVSVTEAHRTVNSVELFDSISTNQKENLLKVLSMKYAVEDVRDVEM